MTAHARLGPSAAGRWTTCPGSVLLIEKLTAEGKVDPRSSSGAADEGTAAHQVRGDALELGLDAWDFIGTSLKINGVDYVCDEEMAAFLQPGMDWLNEQPGELIVEHRVNLDRWLPGQFGTLDTAVIDRKARRLLVSDLKYGQGVAVSAFENKQLRIYAIGTLDNFDLWDQIETVELNIDQPRLGGMKFWSTTTAELLEFAHEVRAAGKLALTPGAPLKASEAACNFCPVKDTEEGCPAYTEWMLSFLPDDVDDDGLLITPARRWEIVSHTHLITKWLAKLYNDSVEAAKGGTPDPGSKLVLGQRGNRKYSNETRAEKVLQISLGDDAYTRKMKSPAQAEKDLAPGKKKVGNAKAWRILNKLITQDDGRPILVPESDPREPVTSLQDELDGLEDLD